MTARDALGSPGQVMSAPDMRHGLAGLLANSGSSPRTGVVWQGGADVVVGNTDTAPMSVTVTSHHWVTSKGDSNGPYLGSNFGDYKAPIGAAPGAGTRVDLVYEMQQDAQALVSPDAVNGAKIDVVPGTPGARYDLVPAGALVLYEVAVDAGATNTAGAGVTLTRKHGWTWPRQAPPPTVQTFTASGTWNKPAGARVVRVRAVGAGGGGGTGAGGAGQAQGGGGGAGGYVEKLYDAATLPAALAVNVGVGGSGASGDGDAGGASSIAGLTAGGGGGGATMVSTAGNSAASGGAGGVATGGDLNVPGGDGLPGRVISGQSTVTAHGGASAMSGMVRSPLASTVDGDPGKAYGGGGAGAFAAATSRAGGDGAAGVVIVETYY